MSHTIILPPETTHFTCFQGICLPTITPPATPEACRKLYPEQYFQSWLHDPVRENRVYIWQDFWRLIRLLEPVTYKSIPLAVAYCWRAKAPLTWAEVYREFPQHGQKSQWRSLTPWYYQRHLALGWDGLKVPLVPKTETGALMYMGDEGLEKYVPNQAKQVGTQRILVHLGFYATVRSPVWNFSVPAKELCENSLCPPETVLLTVQ